MDIEKILDIVRKTLLKTGKSDDLSGITAETDLLAEGYIDSLSLMQVMLQVERHFGVSVPATHLGGTRTSSARRIAEMISNLRHDT